MTTSAASTVSPLEGKTTIDDKMFFGPERLSYQSADDIAEKIAAEVRDCVKDTIVVIAGTPLLADFANLQATYLVLVGLKMDYEALETHGRDLTKRRAAPRIPGEIASRALPESVVAGVGTVATVSTALSAALGLVSLFREDVEYHGGKSVIDPLAFELALASRLKEGGAKKVFVPELMVVPLAEQREGSLRERLEKVQSAKSAAWSAIGPLISQLVGLEAGLDQATKEKDQGLVDQLSAEVSNMRRDLDPVATPLGRVDQRFADLQTQWNQTDQTLGLSLLARLLRAEAIHALSPVYLHAGIVSSGGHHRISRSLFRMIFLGDGLSFAGGAIARWALMEKDGSIAGGGILTVQCTSKTLLGFGDSTVKTPKEKGSAQLAMCL